MVISDMHDQISPLKWVKFQIRGGVKALQGLPIGVNAVVLQIHV